MLSSCKIKYSDTWGCYNGICLLQFFVMFFHDGSSEPCRFLRTSIFEFIRFYERLFLFWNFLKSNRLYYAQLEHIAHVMILHIKLLIYRCQYLFTMLLYLLTVFFLMEIIVWYLQVNKKIVYLQSEVFLWPTSN